MAQCEQHPTGALRSSTELENIFRECRRSKKDLVLFQTFENYNINVDKMSARIEKMILHHNTTHFSDKNIYDTRTTANQRVLNFHQFNLLGRGGPGPNFVFLNYWHAYAYALRINNGPTAYE